MGIEPDGPVDQLGAKGGDSFGKGRWRGARSGKILIAVPGTGDAAVDDFTFTKRAVLMAADIGEGGKLAVVFKDGDAFTVNGNNLRAIVGDGINRKGEHEILVGLWRIRSVHGTF